MPSCAASVPRENPDLPDANAPAMAGTASLARPPESCAATGGSSTRVSSGGGFGARLGFSFARMITYATYRPESMRPGKNAPA